ncbi:glycosyltransferase family 2 protein [Cohnella sp. LGH]|uniref:glycosyltransferase family 2 protein n=1 Tax=Cohnella sp. LGH TaxID=1619153 RepID=UPI001ADBB2A6|nr:glycosyltransferase family 2 protein [Cohnella sp. LGH]QTH42331.1 glycosyltransferase family 2 protein [Cohnella sp. LGH]
MKILIIIPAYNEQDNIQRLIANLQREKQLQYDLLIINDCSTDHTSQVMREMNVPVVDLPCNLGIGGAVQTGYKYAKQHGYDVAVQVDGDGQHNPRFIAKIVEPILKGEADFVIGSRYIEKEGFQSTALRRAGIYYFSKLIYLFTRHKITDPTSGFRACNAEIIDIFAKNYPIDYPEPESIVVLTRKKFRLKEVPVVMEERSAGISSIKSLKSAYYMIKVSLAILIDLLRERTGGRVKSDFV